MRALRKQIVATNLTKYNVGTERWRHPPAVTSKTVILVPGQVESDTYAVYKPHPDVLAGLPQKGLLE